MTIEAFEIEKIESISLLDVKKKFDENKNQPYFKKLLEYYFDYNKLNDLQNFRTFPNFFKKIKLNWILVYEKKQNSNILAGHAIMCKINYNNLMKLNMMYSRFSILSGQLIANNHFKELQIGVLKNINKIK